MKTKLIVTLLSISAILSSNAFAVTFNDGGTHNIDYTIEHIVQWEDPDTGVPLDEPIIIQEGCLYIDRDAPGMHTTVNLLAGGHIISGELKIQNQGCLNMYSGASVNWADVDVSGSGTFNMYGGSVSPWTVLVKDSGTTNIYNGSVAELLTDYVSSAKIMGGVFSDIHSFRNSKIDIYGGKFNTNLASVNSSTITLYGSFNLAYGTYTCTAPLNGNYDTRYLTGTLASGETTTNLQCLTFTGSHLVLAPVPEPATILLLTLGGLILRKKH